jgi:hypothetical protein
MPCPECEQDIDGIEVSASEGSRTETFWGSSVRVDESEAEADFIPDCPECKKVTVDESKVVDYFWERIA